MRNEPTLAIPVKRKDSRLCILGSHVNIDVTTNEHLYYGKHVAVFVLKDYLVIILVVLGALDYFLTHRVPRFRPTGFNTQPSYPLGQLTDCATVGVTW